MPGDLVRITPDVTPPYGDDHSPFVVTRTIKPCDSNLVGFLIDPAKGVAGDKVNEHYLIYGYFPGKVTMENGPIRRGDPITSSSKPGYGMKAIGACKIIGYALENANREGKIQVFAHLSENASPHIVRLQARMNRLRRDNIALHKQNAALQKRSDAVEAQLQNVLQQVQAMRAELRSRSAQAEVHMPNK